MQSPVSMEGDEMEMTEVELRRWIRRMVRRNQRIVALVKKRNLLRSLLTRWESQANQLQELSRSLAACEALVKRHYSLLGWEYQYTCSDDELSATECDSPPTHETPDHGSLCANRLTPSLEKPVDGPNLCTVNGKTFHINLNRKPVVVLVPLSPRLISSLRPPLAKSSNTEDCNNFKSDSSFGPDSDKDSKSNFSMTNDDTRPKKRQKMAEDNMERDDFSTDPASQQRRTSSTNTCTAISNRLAESKPPANNDVQDPSSNPDTEICINMKVLARNRINIWHKGKIIEIERNGCGVQMYKVCFEDEKKDLVYGSHMAFGNSSGRDQLSVGSCVVVERENRVPRFCSGIVAELPTLKNKQRFLVFFDDHTPVYVTSSSIHCLCKPLKNTLDDISDTMHKNFMQEYLDKWPCVPRAQYSVGQNIFATFNGLLQACKVLITDSSLIQVVFEFTKHKEWIYRGSPRLEHIQNVNRKNSL